MLNDLRSPAPPPPPHTRKSLFTINYYYFRSYLEKEDKIRQSLELEDDTVSLDVQDNTELAQNGIDFILNINEIFNTFL